MIAFDPKLLHGLEWKQPSAFKRAFFLHAGESVLASVEWQKTFGSLAEARTSERVWTFKRQGFLNPRVNIRAAGSEEDLAIYEPHWGGGKGVLRGPGARLLNWRRKSMLGGEFEWQSPDGATLVHFHIHGILKHGAEVTVAPGATDDPDIALLLTLGWYVLVLQIEDSAVAAAG
jgi:hypothetical protein